MVQFRSRFSHLLRIGGLSIVLMVAFTHRPAQARQVLLLTNQGNNTVGEYNAVTGGTINSTFVNNTQGLNLPYGLAVDGNSHLFVVNAAGNTVSQFNATTGATINATFVNSTQGLSAPLELALSGNNLFVTNANTNAVGQYNATTGATINASFINSTQGLNSPHGVVADALNHILVANFAGNTVG